MSRLIVTFFSILGILYTIYSVPKLIIDETEKIKTSYKVDSYGVFNNTTACFKEYKSNGSNKYGDVDLGKVENWAVEGFKLCHYQVPLSGLNVIKTSWELRLIPLKSTIPYELIRELSKGEKPQSCKQAIQQLTYICPNYIKNNVINN